MAQRQRQLVLGADAVVVVAEVRVANAASGDLDQNLVRTEGRRLEFLFDKGFALAPHQPARRPGHLRPQTWPTEMCMSAA